MEKKSQERSAQGSDGNSGVSNLIGSCHSQPAGAHEGTRAQGTSELFKEDAVPAAHAQMAVGVVFSKPFSFHWSIDYEMIF